MEEQAVRTPRLGDWLISATLFVFFGGSFLLSEAWPYRAALFPKIVAATGLALAVLKLAGLIRQSLRSRTSAVGRSAPAPSAPAASAAAPSAAAPPAAEGTPELALALVDDEAEEDASMEYVFATAGRRAWAEAMLWIVAFFVAFVVLGAFISVPVFALLYLRFAGKASWLGAAVYAAITGALIYGVFQKLVFLPLPTGIFPIGG